MSLATGRAAAVLLNVQLRTAPRLKATLLATAAIWAVTAVSPAHVEQGCFVESPVAPVWQSGRRHA